MQRISLVEKDQAHPLIREMYQKREEHGLQLFNFFKVMGHCPYIGLNLMRLGNSIRRGEELAPKLRELAILRVGSLLQAEYEFRRHIPLALQAGVSQQQIDAISDWSASAEFNEQERAMLQYADEVTQGIRVKDETFTELQGFLSEHAIVELTTVISYYCMVCRILIALQVELEPEFR
ncbi:carboxymuconolactone decarboxylase family protein [Chloroflexota bacterium]